MPNMAAPAAPCFSQINRLTITALEVTPHHTSVFRVSWRRVYSMLQQHDIVTTVLFVEKTDGSVTAVRV